MLNITKLSNGNLHLSIPNNDDWAELQENYQAMGELAVWYDLIGPFQVNGMYFPIDAEDIGALTGDPYLLTDDLDIEDNGERTVKGNVWHCPDYAIISVIEQLLQHGEYDLHLIS